MSDFDLRDIHDWNNSMRSYIDGFEVLFLLLPINFGLVYAAAGTGLWTNDDGLQSGPIWKLFASWYGFRHFLVGVSSIMAGLLLLRDWKYCLDEREEERRRRNAWKEEFDRLNGKENEISN